MTTESAVLLGARAIIALTFAMASLPKLRALQRFQLSVRAYGVIPERLNTIAAVSVAAGELTVALSLSFGFFVFLGTVIAVICLTSFIAVGLLALRRGHSAPCGCFGNDAETLSSKTIVRALSLILVAMPLLIEHYADWKTPLLFDMRVIALMPILWFAIRPASEFAHQVLDIVKIGTFEAHS